MTHFSTGLPGACFFLLLLGRGASSPLFLNEGDACSDGGAQGTCRRVRLCEPARRALDERLPLPTRCGFLGYEEVVCCVTNADRNTGAPGVDSANDNVKDSDGDSNNIADSWKKPSGDRPSVAACKYYRTELDGLTYHILSGQNARDKEFPHMAALGYRVTPSEGLSWGCGGSLISDQYVLTAAHCCSSRASRRPIRVQLGKLNITSGEDSDSLYRIKDIFIHPNYKKPYYSNDIALLKLDRKVQFDESVSPACLYTKSDDPSSFVATGWGATNAVGTRMSSALLKTTISPFPMSECQNTYRSKFPEGLGSSVICAGDPQGKTDTCSGDSGGPLQVSEDDGPCSVVGITSIGPKPCGGTIPSIYTRVSSYLDWIEKYAWS